ncbi:MAG: TVP38/TMEM64 family protein [Clostridia bacterium]|nr:TVP38/TMEM64 family protein [Clostridia bacterium]
MKKSKAALVLSLASAVFLVLTVVLIILFREYLSDAEKVRALVSENYFLGALCLLLICAVQVVVALVPGELVEIAAGYAFGAVWGTIICVAGMILGSIAVILLVRKFGRKFVYAFYPKEKMDNLPILRDPKKRNTLVLILFLIPGTPKDMFTYAIGLTDMSIPLYLLLTTFARLPSVVSSTVGGNAVGEKNYVAAVIIFVVTALVSGGGLLLYRWIQKRHQKRDQ